MKKLISFFMNFFLVFLLSLNVFSQSVIIETSLGSIEAELNKEKAPLTVKNFLNYVIKINIFKL